MANTDKDNENAIDDDAVAAEWTAMAEDEAGDADMDATSSQPTRVLNQDEIDSLLGFDDQVDGAGKTGMNALFNSTMVSYPNFTLKG